MHHKVVFITGVSASGKTTVGSLLAKQQNIPFYDADDFHSRENIKKMANGISLTDADRIPWLTSINTFVVSQLQSTSIVFACSALKETYRQLLAQSINQQQIKWVYLQGTFEVIEKRMEQRINHFMPSILLQSQFEIAEVPSNSLILDIGNTPEQMVQTIQEKIF
jgi:carbohydrate kinase (thermoresistant glucokinase family)